MYSSYLHTVFADNGLHISDSTVNLLEKYTSLLTKWNKRLNLISRRDEENITRRHILGSVSFLFKFELRPYSSLIDVGTGGGLPGIPLGILNPQLRITLIDSIQKKINAVTEMLLELALSNIKAVCARAEDLAKKKEFKSAFDYVISRGVASTGDIVRWTKPFLKTNPSDTAWAPFKPHCQMVNPGSIILLKGGDLVEEIREATLKVKPRSINVYPITIRGSESAPDLVDKKIVVVYP